MFKKLTRYSINSLSILFFLVLLGCSMPANNEDSSNNEGSGDSQVNESKEQTTYWGIDTASVLEEDSLVCIRDNYGDPSFAGRYLETKEDVSFGLTQEEVEFLHGEDLKIILIYNHFTDATTHEKGKEEAEEAISYAEDLGVPEGEYIFADVEPSYPVDREFILGWTEVMNDSPYKPGLYGIFSEQTENNLLDEYLKFKEENSEASDQLALWVSEVNIGITTKENAPTEFNPDVPDNVNAHIWQYGIDGESCNIDTNLTETNMFEELW